MATDERALAVPALLARVAAGDAAAVRELLSRYANLVWSIARRFDPADAEGAVQEIFLDLWGSAGRHDAARGTEATFIAMIARRRLIDRRRMLRRRPQASVQIAEVVLEELAADGTSPAATADAIEAAHALDQLHPEQRQVVVLSTCHGLSHDEIAQQTGMPLGTVMDHARRASSAIRTAVSGVRASVVTGDPLHPRGEELLAERALRPLDDQEHRELQHLGLADDDSFDLAAAAVVVATTVLEPMPSTLVEQILARAPGAGTLDWKRTLPGVSMPSPADLPHDTLVGVELAELVAKNQPVTEPLLAQRELAKTKLMGVPSAALDTLPPPLVKRPPAIQAPSLDDRPRTPTPAAMPVTDRAPDLATSVPAVGRAPTPMQPLAPGSQAPPRASLPQDSQPFSIETPPPALPISRDRSTPLAAVPPEIAATVPLRPASRSVLPWLAAAACLLVASGAVWWALSHQAGPATLPAVATSPATARAALLASATDLAKLPWMTTQDLTAHGASGDVVWSPSAQRGYLRFVGLAPNDPAQFQYQLWIFDKTRDQAFPIDGGVFDVTSNGEVIIAIDPELHVNDLGMFAVTVERPGGVVVSKREHIVVTATRT
ncbi:MAG: sigma-70 family RNA polymerase sigma factor [Kofleriaceae bacterium]